MSKRIGSFGINVRLYTSRITNSFKGRYTNHVVFFSHFWPPPLSPLLFYVVFFIVSPPSPKKNNVACLKKWVFTGRLFKSQRSTGYHYYLLYFIRQIRYNINRSVRIADGERKGDCERKEGATRTRKICAFCAGYNHGFRKKNNSQKDNVVFVGPPPPPTWFDVVLQGTSPPP